jgi:isoleucyl-tRNA synthetase
LETEKKEKSPYVVSLIGSLLVVLNTEMTPELREEGLMLEFVRRTQVMRKELDLEYTQKISLFFETEDQELLNSIKKHENYIANETLSTSMQIGIPTETTYTKDWKIGDKTIKIAIKT